MRIRCIITTTASAAASAALASLLLPTPGANAQGSSAPAAPAWLTDAQLSALITGKTVDGRRPDGITFSETFHRNGKLTGHSVRPNGNTYDDAGTWRIKGNQYCVTWSMWTNGLERCFWVRQVGPNKYINRGEHGYEKQLTVE